MCKALLLTGVLVELDDLEASHRMRKKDRVTIKLKCRNQRYLILSNRKTLKNKSLDLT